MKLIIDIPDSDYERIKDLVATDTQYTTATTVGTAYQVIANGTTVSTDGDLISREALKEVLKECAYSNDGVNTWIMKDEVLGIIDNASTVDTYTIEDIQEVRENALILGAKLAQRPEGEWVEKQETPASVSYYCSNCKMSDLPVLPYCPWCGAKMKND